MRVEPRPTRAEVSDAANSRRRGRRCDHAGRRDGGRRVSGQGGADARRGHPRCRVAAAGSFVGGLRKRPGALDAHGSRHGQALAQAAVTLATTGQADAIVAVTTEGRTARLLSACRPAAPILAAIPDGAGRRRALVAVGSAPVVTAGAQHRSSDAGARRPRPFVSWRGRRVHQRQSRTGSDRRQLPSRPTDQRSRCSLSDASDDCQPRAMTA